MSSAKTYDVVVVGAGVFGAWTALALAPEDPVVLVTVGGAHEALGDRSEAIQFVQKGIQNGSTLDDLQRDPDMQALLNDPSFKVRAKK